MRLGSNLCSRCISIVKALIPLPCHASPRKQSPFPYLIVSVYFWGTVPKLNKETIQNI